MKELFNSDSAEELSKGYQKAQPFPHIILDHFFQEEILKKVLSEFPRIDQLEWHHYNNEKEKNKFESKHETELGDATRSLVHELNAAPFLNFLEKLTGIQGLLPDPYLFGGGLHQIQEGGYLSIHADFNWHSKLKIYRRLNVLIYLNENWEEEYGGHLELWDRNMQNCVKKISPIFNRTVIFNTSHFAFHGHPEPLRCPKGRTRKSLALYYYTSEKAPEDTREHHNTLWKKRPLDIWQNESIADRKKLFCFKSAVKKIVPPILIDFKNSIQNLFR